jgi:hypothetical protein
LVGSYDGSEVGRPEVGSAVGGGDGLAVGKEVVGDGVGKSVKMGAFVGWKNVGLVVGGPRVGFAEGGEGFVGAIVCRVGEGVTPTASSSSSSSLLNVGALDKTSSSDGRVGSLVGLALG